MIKDDERKLMKTALEKEEGKSFMVLGEELQIPSKRLRYLLGKWSVRGWYDYGVCVDRGWLTLEGTEHLKNEMLLAAGKEN